MSNTVIQILRSYANTAPLTLKDGEIDEQPDVFVDRTDRLIVVLALLLKPEITLVDNVIYFV
jgi:hypothetical protein